MHRDVSRVHCFCDLVKPATVSLDLRPQLPYPSQRETPLITAFPAGRGRRRRLQRRSPPGHRPARRRAGASDPENPAARSTGRRDAAVPEAGAGAGPAVGAGEVTAPADAPAGSLQLLGETIPPGSTAACCGPPASLLTAHPANHRCWSSMAWARADPVPDGRRPRRRTQRHRDDSARDPGPGPRPRQGRGHRHTDRQPAGLPARLPLPP